MLEVGSGELYGREPIVLHTYIHTYIQTYSNNKDRRQDLRCFVSQGCEKDHLSLLCTASRTQDRHFYRSLLPVSLGSLAAVIVQKAASSLLASTSP